ncbi:MAG: metallophosphoesterase family protein [Planctomycetota bacterium]
MRQFAIGDIHGCAKALRALLESIDPQPEDEFVFLGDYIDRGPNSRDVIEQLIQLQQLSKVVALRGNHEIMMLGVVLGGLDPKLWLASGGVATLSSYGGSLRKLPASHLEFFQSLLPYHETDSQIFVHASYRHDRDMVDQDESDLYWTHLMAPPPPHVSGKRVYVGHTPQTSGNVLDLGHLVCVDTYCFGRGYLTALETTRGDCYQFDASGFRRRASGIPLWQRLRWLSRTARRWYDQRRPLALRSSKADEGESLAGKLESGQLERPVPGERELDVTDVEAVSKTNALSPQHGSA